MTTILNIRRTVMFKSIILGVLILSAVGCGGMKPNPIYNSGKSETPTPKRVDDSGRTNKSTLLSAGKIRSNNKVLMLKSINSYKGVPYLCTGAEFWRQSDGDHVGIWILCLPAWTLPGGPCAEPWPVVIR